MAVSFVDWDRRPAISGIAPDGKPAAFASLDGSTWSAVDGDDVLLTGGVMAEDDWWARFSPPPFSAELSTFVGLARRFGSE